MEKIERTAHKIVVEEAKNITDIEQAKHFRKVITQIANELIAEKANINEMLKEYDRAESILAQFINHPPVSINLDAESDAQLELLLRADTLDSL